MNIPEEAIEAATDAYRAGEVEASRRGIESTAHYFGIKYALEAAAPLLMAQALREVHAWADEHHPWIGLMDLKEHIEERANELEGKS